MAFRADLKQAITGRRPLTESEQKAKQKGYNQRLNSAARAEGSKEAQRQIQKNRSPMQKLSQGYNVGSGLAPNKPKQKGYSFFSMKL